MHRVNRRLKSRRVRLVRSTYEVEPFARSGLPTRDLRTIFARDLEINCPFFQKCFSSVAWSTSLPKTVLMEFFRPMEPAYPFQASVFNWNRPDALLFSCLKNLTALSNVRWPVNELMIKRDLVSTARKVYCGKIRFEFFLCLHSTFLVCIKPWVYRSFELASLFQKV